MSDEVVYEQLDQDGGNDAVRGSEADLRRLSEVPMEASVEIGRTAMTVGDTLDLRPGSIVVLDRMAGEPVDLYVNGTLIASGEVVVVDDQFGLRVNEIVEEDPGAAFALAPAGEIGSQPRTVGDDGPGANPATEPVKDSEPPAVEDDPGMQA